MIIPTHFVCTACGKQGANQENFTHLPDCSFLKELLFREKQEYLMQYLDRAIPQSCKDVYNWPGLNTIAKYVLEQMEKDRVWE